MIALPANTVVRLLAVMDRLERACNNGNTNGMDLTEEEKQLRAFLLSLVTSSTENNHMENDE